MSPLFTSKIIKKMNRRKALSGMGALVGSAAFVSPLLLNAGEPAGAYNAPIPRSDSRKISDLSGVWKFQVDIQDIGEKEKWYAQGNEGSDWGTGLVPQAWDCYEEGLWQYEGVAWYKTVIAAGDFDASRISSILFRRVMYHSKLWVNGEYVGENTNGYLPFEFDITSLLKPKENNFITLRADNRPRLEWLPAAKEIEWILYGGILGKVFLTGMAPLHISDLGITTSGKDEKAVVHCRVEIVNKDKSPVSPQVLIEILREGTVIKKTMPVKLGKDGKESFSLDLEINSPAWWSPESPALYTAKASLLNKGMVVDDVSERFGIRTIATEGQAILLNGKPLLIKGVNRYDDYGRMGPTPPEQLVREELKMIKSTGVNMIRVHYPQNPDLLDLYDEYGFLMMEEIPFCWWGGKDAVQSLDILQQAKPALTTMIKRDKNHPCIIIWSMCNECITTNETAITVLRDLLTQAKTLDPSRLVTYVLNGYENPLESKAYDKADVIAINTYNGSIQGTPSNHIGDIEKNGYEPFVQKMTKHRKDMPEKPMYLGEFGSPGIRHIHGDLYNSEEFQAAYIKRIWQAIMDVDGLSGGILWCWADYYHRQHFVKYTAFGPYGVVSTDRKPKKSFDTLKEIFTKK